MKRARVERGVLFCARGMASFQGKGELRHADWMANLPANLHTLPLTNLAIPGECARYSDTRTHARARKPLGRYGVSCT